MTPTFGIFDHIEDRRAGNPVIAGRHGMSLTEEEALAVSRRGVDGLIRSTKKIHAYDHLVLSEADCARAIFSATPRTATSRCLRPSR